MKNSISNMRRAPAVTRVQVFLPEKLSVIYQWGPQAVLQDKFMKNNDTEKL